MTTFLTRDNIEDVYPMSDVARGMIYHSSQNPASGMYCNQNMLRLKITAFSAETLERAVRLLARRHPILRTGFNMTGFDESIMMVYRDVPLDIRHRDISDLGQKEEEESLAGFLVEDRLQPFEIERFLPLWRLRTFSLAGGDIAFAWSCHHAMTDGWSSAVFLKELYETYLALTTDADYMPAPLPCTYKDFVLRQLEAKEDEAVLDFWRRELDGYHRLPFPATQAESPGFTTGHSIRRSLGTEFLNQIKAAARRENSAVKNICFAAYMYMLSMLSYENDILAGLITNNRPESPDSQWMLGCFLNTLPVRLKIPAGLDWRGFLRLVDQKLVELKRYEHLSFFEIVRLSGERPKGVNPLFDTVFNFIDFHVFAGADALYRRQGDGGVSRIEAPGYGGGATNTLFDITIDAGLGKFDLILLYSPSLLSEDEVQRLTGYFEAALQHIVNRPSVEVKKEDLLTTEEKERMLYLWSGAIHSNPAGDTLPKLFEEQVARSPNQKALIIPATGQNGILPAESLVYTYEELNRAANRLAHYLIAHGAVRGTLAAVLLEDPIDIAVTIIAVLKAGAAYVPVDPHYPPDRLSYILHHSGAAMAIVRSREVDVSLPVVSLDAISPDSFPTGNPDAGILPGDAAYAIYTSGTSGRPKGVLVEHRSIVNTLSCRRQEYGLGSGQKALQLFSPSFDGFLTSFFSPLVGGSCVVWPEHGARANINLIGDIIQSFGVTHVIAVPMLFRAIVEHVPAERLQSLEVVTLAGDTISEELVNIIGGALPKLELSIEYGVTEAAVMSTIQRNQKPGRVVSIGAPVWNTRIFVVDCDLQLLPPGSAGELCIAGAGVARGYLGDPELTREKFVPELRGTGSYMYRTGDLVRYLSDGRLQFLGRRDLQVKIRGFRIETGEIENQLLCHPSVKDVVVTIVTRRNREPELAAYVVAHREEALDFVFLKEFLSNRLPGYMLPGYIVPIEALPQTPTGKVDRNALPQPWQEGVILPVPPKTGTQRKLAEMWSSVLKMEREKIGLEQDFFQLGGHSLNATVLAAKIQNLFNVSVSLQEIFKHSTLQEMAACIDRTLPGAQSSYVPMEKREYYPLSSSQRRLFLLSQMAESSTVYHIPLAVSLEGELDPQHIEAVFKTLIYRHESLRTRFIAVEGQPVQQVLDEVEFHLAVNGNGDDFLLRPMDLSRAPLVRAILVRKDSCRHDLLMEIHHIVADGISMAIFIREFLDLLAHRTIQPLNLHYRDIALRQAGDEYREVLRRQRAWWLEQYRDGVPRAGLPLDFSRPAVQTFEGLSQPFVLDRELVTQLKGLADREGATLFMVLLTVFHVFLSKLSGSDDLVIGIPVAGRRDAVLDNVIGMFVNTLALRLRLGGERPFQKALGDVKTATLAAFERQEVRLEDLIDTLPIERDTSRNPLFDVVFSMQNIDVDLGERRVGKLTLTPLPIENRTAKFDLTLQAAEKNGELACLLEYNTNLFRPDTIRRFVGYFRAVVESAVADDALRLDDIDIIPALEKRRLLMEWNDTDAQYPVSATLAGLLENQAGKMPDRTALTLPGTGHVTYRWLMANASRLAVEMRRRGAGSGNLAALLFEPSIEMVVGIVAALLSGAGYVPIDPSYPEQRIAFMVRDSNAAVLVTGGEAASMGLIDRMAPEGGIVNVAEGDDTPCGIDREISARPQDPAYVIYTSGTTGRPKGVVIEHRHVARLLFNDRFQFDFDERDVWTLFHSYCFDFSVWEMYGALLRGGRLVVVPRMTARDIPAFHRLLKMEVVTVLNQTPSAFYRLSAEMLSGKDDRMPLRLVIFGGEALNPGLLARWRRAYPSVTLVNMYGITETTVHVTYKEIGEREIRAGQSAIGGPIPTLRCLVMDRSGRLAATGVAGELWVGGAGVARGYLNQPELTAEKFTKSRYYDNQLLYRSGDLVKWTCEGELLYLGRIDQQVKIRGHRIELAEVEARILALPEVKQALVMHIKEEGDDFLCAYVAANRDLPAGELRRTLSESLPGYMIPSFFIVMESFPLTPNGKVDRRALPEPRPQAGGEAEAPEGALELELAAIWAEVLGIDEACIGVRQNFFDLGGHSLKASQVTALIHERLEVSVPLAEMFKTPTIEELAAYIRLKEKESLPKIESSEVMDYYPLSSPQRRLFSLQQLDLESVVYHIPMAVQLDGNLSRERMEDVFAALIRRHEALRTAFVVNGGSPVQKIHPYVEFSIESLSSVSWEHDFIRPFDLGRPPLLRVGLTCLSGERHLLVLDMHHLVADGRSLQILLEEFLLIYKGDNLPKSELRYRDFVMWQQNGAHDGPMARQLDFWLRRLEGELPALNMPLDFSRPPVQSFSGDRLEFEIPPALAREMRQLASSQGVTLYMAFLTVFHLFLSRIAGQDEMVLGTPVEGRRHPGLRNVLGMFVNTLPLRLRCRSEQSFVQNLHEVKTVVLEAFANQETPLEDIVAQSNVTRDRSRNPIFDVVFTLQEGGRTGDGIADIKATPVESPRRFSKFDLTLQLLDRGHSLWGEMEYCTALYKTETIERFSRLFLQLVEKIAMRPEARIGQLELVSQREKERILSEFNNTFVSYSADETVLDLFMDRAKAHPDSLAVVGRNAAGEDGNLQLSYGELARTSSLWGQVLTKRLGHPGGGVVAVMLPPSLEMAQAQLGILMAGAAFLPIDDGLPEERVRVMLKDSSVSAIVTSGKNRTSLPENIVVFSSSPEERFLEAGDEEFSRPLPGDLAYVIYTSGSSGMPKGVAVEHRGLYNLCRWHNDAFAVACSDHATRYAGFGFDASVWETFPYLCAGAALFMIPEGIRLDMGKLNNYFERYHITIAFLPTQICQQFARRENASLRLLLTGGDELQEVFPTSYQLVNNYGPSENTVVASSAPVATGDGVITIGSPIHNNRIYIVDSNLNLQPVGIPGELCVAGKSLARGYVNRPELTADAFVPDPFVTGGNGARQVMYRTGDRACFLPDGRLQFLGRVDRQVKIRGLRIEPGEIQQSLIQHPDVSGAFVRVIEAPDGSKSLCAYVVPGNGRMEISEVKTWLSRKLPSYMIPRWFVQVGELPLTTSGKVSVHELPLPAMDASGDEYAAPTNELEELMQEIWQQVLGQKSIGIHDDFFAVGGDSIKAIQVVSRLRSAGYLLETKDLFRQQTIAATARCVRRGKGEAPQIPVTGPVPLTPIQAEFFARKPEEPHHFNQAVMLRSREGFPEETARRILETLTAHHDALRMTFRRQGESVLQENGPPGKAVDLAVFDWRERADAPRLLAAEVEKAQAGIDLERGPLMKSALFRLSSGDRWLIVIHHLVVDGVSWRILLEDIDALMRQIKEERPLSLPPKTDSFKQWAGALRHYAGSREFESERNYWERRLGEDVAPLPVESALEANLEQDAARVAFSLEEGDTLRLLQEANAAFGTRIDDILLAALALAMKRVFDRRRVWVALEGHGREPITDLDINRTVGWFTAAYPVLLDLSHEGGLDRHIRDIKESLHRIPNRGVGYGILKYCADPSMIEGIDLAHRPQVSFNYLGQFDSDVTGELFQVAEESPGRMQSLRQERQFDIDVSGMVSGGRLSVSLTYGSRRYRAETMKRLSGVFEEALLQVIDFCCRQEKRRYTPSDFSLEEMSVEELDELSERWNIEDIYPLSPMQEGMLFHSLAAGDEPVYFEQMSYRLHGDFSVELIAECWGRLFKHYEVLRTAFIAGDRERPLQIVVKDRPAEFVFNDLGNDQDGLTPTEAASAFKLQDRERSFRLEEDPLMRLAVLRLGDRLFEFVWSFHHILMDGWCSGILMRDFFHLYNHGLHGALPELEAQAPYRTYIHWLECQDRQESERYWRQYLEGYDEAAGLPGDVAVSAGEEGYRVSEVSLQLDADATALLKKFAAFRKATLNTLAQAVWGIVLGRYNNREDVVFGAVVSGRPSSVPGVETMVGLFINTVPVRVRFHGETTFDELMAEIQTQALAAEAHHYFPLADIQAASPLRRHLLDHIVEFQNFPIAQQVAGLLEEQIETENQKKDEPVEVQTFEQTNYDLNLTIGAGEKLMIRFDFNESVYSRRFLQRVLDHFPMIFEQILADRRLKVRRISLLREEERKQIVDRFNNKRREFPQHTTVYRLIEDHARSKPDCVALVDDGGLHVSAVTYGELDRRSEALALELRRLGVGEDVTVGVLMERSAGMAEAILAVWKAGGAYIPIDTNYPETRVAGILEDSRSPVLISRGYALYRGQVLNPDDVDWRQEDGNCRAADGNAVKPHSLAYVIYTSGSTGKPKGAMVEHIGMMNHMQAKIDDLGLRASSIIAQNASHTFDISVWQFFVALVAGGRTIVFPETVVLEPELLLQRAIDQRLTVLEVVPSYLSVLLDTAAARRREFLPMEYLMVTGEEVKPALLRQWFDAYPAIPVVNAYGPTEASDDITHYIMNAPTQSRRVPVGFPLQNLTIYIVDRYMNICPVGMKGEICVSGVGVGRGYLFDPERTQQVFMEDPFASQPGVRLYKTGDLGAWREDGAIDFFGRIDYQVKIRGFRIELGEIENLLAGHDSVKETVVIDREGADGKKYLCAYVVPADGGDIHVPEVKDFLADRLPGYMIPSFFVPLDALPLNPNGKVDRKALPEPRMGEAFSPASLPRDAVELELQGLWAEILDAERRLIDIDSNFFELGGHSLKVTVLVSRIHRALDVKVPIVEVFRRPTIRQLAEFIKGAEESRYASIQPGELREYYPLSSAQKRMFLVSQLKTADTSDNSPEVMLAEGKLDLRRFRETIEALTGRHETLRTSFHLMGDQPVQRVHRQAIVDITHMEACLEQLPDTVAQFIRPFDLGRPPLFRVGLATLTDGQFAILFDIHHIISDGISSIILMKEFVELYNRIPLPPLRLQYRDFAYWQQRLFASTGISAQEDFWRETFSGELPKLALPVDFPRPAMQSYEGEHLMFECSPELSGQISELALESGTTLFIVMLALFNVLLSKYSGQDDIIVGTPTAGRPHVDLESLIGMFVNTLALRNHPSGGISFREFLEDVGDRTLKAFENQDFQFEQLVERLGILRDASRNMLFDVMLAVANVDAGGRQEGIRDVTFKPFQFEGTTTPFDLVMYVYEREVLSFKLMYCTRLFKRETIEAMARHFIAVASQAVKNPEIRIEAIQMFSAEEKERLFRSKKEQLEQLEVDFDF